MPDTGALGYGGYTGFGAGYDFDTEQAQLRRKRAMYDALLGDITHKGNWGAAIGLALRNAIKGDPGEELDAAEKDFGRRIDEASSDWLRRMPRDQPGMPEMGPPTAEGEMQSAVAPKYVQPEDMLGWSIEGQKYNAAAKEMSKLAMANALKGDEEKYVLGEIGVPGRPGAKTKGRFRKGTMEYVGPAGSPVEEPVDPGRAREKIVEDYRRMGYSDPQARQIADKLITHHAMPYGVVGANVLDFFGSPQSQPTPPVTAGPQPSAGGPAGPARFNPGAFAPGMRPVEAPTGAPPAAAPQPTPVAAGAPVAPPVQSAAPSQGAAAPVDPNDPDEGVPLTGIYALPKPPPGVKIQADPNNTKGRQARKEDVEKYGELVQAQEALRSRIDDVNALLRKYPKGQVPGIGVGRNALPSGLQPEEGGSDAAITARNLQNAIARLNAGLSQTGIEVINVKEGLGRGALNSEADFRNAVKGLSREIDRVKKAMSVRFDPSVKVLHDRRVGGAKTPVDVDTFLDNFNAGQQQ